MSDWRTVKLGDLGRIVTGKTPPASQPEMFFGPIPFLTPTDMSDDCRHVATGRSVSPAWDSKRRTLLPAHSVCVVCIGATIGKICMTVEPTQTNQQVNSIIVDTDQFNPYFVYYALRLKVQELKARAAGAATPIINKSVFSDVTLDLPDHRTQARIATILEAYDDMIEVNQRRVALLEGMSGRLFEEWFVRFRFPGHETVAMVDTPDGPLPERWLFASLPEAVEIMYGFPFKSKGFSNTPEGSRVVRIRDVPAGRTSTWTPEAFDPKYGVADGDLLVGMDGIFHTAVWVGGPAALNQRVARLRPLQGRSVSWVFHSVLSKIKFFESTISGTTVAHLGARHLNSIKVPVASPSIQLAADKVFSSIDRQLVSLRRANESLAASRDLLLPRLISGQLSVAVAERELLEAA